MYIFAQFATCLFPIAAFLLIAIGIKKQAFHFVTAALWLSLIALMIHFQSSGGQVLGSYFNYLNALTYTLNLLLLVTAFLFIMSHLHVEHPVFKYMSGFTKSLVLISALLVLINLWINAFFIENRKTGSPIMQIALMNKLQYCSYRYIFYKIANDGTMYYLCPEHYGLLPSVGPVSISLDALTSQFSFFKPVDMEKKISMR